MPAKPKSRKPLKPTSAPAGKTGRMASFAQELHDALWTAVSQLRERIGNERLYAFALYTSGQDDFSYVCASANTEEALTRVAATYATRNAEYVGEAGRKLLRWSAPDWEWHDCAKEVSCVQLPVGEGAARDAKVYTAFIHALRALQQEGAFGENLPTPTLAVMCGDMDAAFLLRSLAKLNPKPIVDAYRKEHTPGPFLDELVRMPVASQLDAALTLYRELSLDLMTPQATDARRRNVSEYDLEALISDLGSVAVSRLLDLVEENGFGPTFNARDGAAWKKRGAFTAEADLAASAMLLVEKAGIKKDHVERIQALLARRVELDRAVTGPTSVLAAIAARVLNKAFRRRFPEAQQNERTNHLDNPEPFLRHSS
jgi:hypothetical protein